MRRLKIGEETRKRERNEENAKRGTQKADERKERKEENLKGNEKEDAGEDEIPEAESKNGSRDCASINSFAFDAVFTKPVLPASIPIFNNIKNIGRHDWTRTKKTG